MSKIFSEETNKRDDFDVLMASFWGWNTHSPGNMGVKERIHPVGLFRLYRGVAIWAAILPAIMNPFSLNLVVVVIFEACTGGGVEWWKGHWGQAREKRSSCFTSYSFYCGCHCVVLMILFFFDQYIGRPIVPAIPPSTSAYRHIRLKYWFPKDHRS